MSRKATGRVKVGFDVIQKVAAQCDGLYPFRPRVTAWRLTRHSALYRRKDGSFTLCLVFQADDMTMTHTIRGIRMELA